jgi:hypothetical protein
LLKKPSTGFKLPGQGPAPQLQINELYVHVALVSDLRETFSATFLGVAEKVVDRVKLPGQGPAPQLQINELYAHVARVSDLRETFSGTFLAAGL